MSTDFALEIIDLHWITPEDDGNDLCAHGKVYLKIGATVLADNNTGDWMLSATALYMLRTLENDYQKDNALAQILPCCGHFLMPHEDSETCTIHGCFTGIDWQVIHDNGSVKLILEDGSETVVGFDKYKKTVLEFVDKVEQFYITALPRILPEDKYDKKGYEYFWKEWRRLRDKW